MNHAKQPDANLPRWQNEINEKHAAQIKAHEKKFGKLGELQTPSQKQRLKEAIAK